MQETDPMLSTKELATYLGVPVQTIHTWRHKGDAPPGVRLGRHLRFRRRDVEQWIDAKRQAEEADRPSAA